MVKKISNDTYTNADNFRIVYAKHLFLIELIYYSNILILIVYIFSKTFLFIYIRKLCI